MGFVRSAYRLKKDSPDHPRGMWLERASLVMREPLQLANG